MMKRLATAAAAALTVLSLAACGSGSPSGGTQTAGGAGGQAQKITVGVIPIVDTAPIWLGKSKGFFTDEGLDLDIQTATGGSAIVPGVQSGSYDFAFSNLISVMVARDKGLDMRFVADGASSTGDPAKEFGAVLVKGDSPIKTAKDLAGKKVSVNNLSNIGDTTIKSVVEKAGGDPSSLQFVEVAFPDAQAALDKGVVDAAWILDPFRTAGVEAGDRVLSNNFVEFDPKLDIAGYFTSGDTIKNKPELAGKFTRAMNKSLEYAQGHPQEVRDIVGTYTKIDAATRAKMNLPLYRSAFDKGAVKKLGDAAQKYGTLTKPVNLDELLPR
ncbi:ABC transporter substrate-binding protein [Sinomonas notoginsengisoli]|uniref:ABC transporter substrate-binding protein n=1 Tax=Sinomonas notoginsengisoli TaxID=1457311 RepID=UPI0027E00B40|nr:ABC transporter substrate-binding protein [Sinomonas notoginsengisoli]